MSGWSQSQNFGYTPDQHQGFYNPSAPTETPSFYGNYETGNNPSSSSFAPGPINYMTPDPIGSTGSYDSAGNENFGQEDEFANEAPLLEELGINPEHIFQKTLAVLNPFRATRPEVAGDSDLAGPLVITNYLLQIKVLKLVV
jgi:hypothetical protein